MNRNPLCVCSHTLSSHNKWWWDEDDTGASGRACDDSDGCDDFKEDEMTMKYVTLNYEWLCEQEESGMTSTGRDHDWPMTEETYAICEGCSFAISPYRTADGWYWRHRATATFICPTLAPMHAHVNGTTKVPGYED